MHSYNSQIGSGGVGVEITLQQLSIFIDFEVFK